MAWGQASQGVRVGCIPKTSAAVRTGERAQLTVCMRAHWRKGAATPLARSSSYVTAINVMQNTGRLGGEPCDVTRRLSRRVARHCRCSAASGRQLHRHAACAIFVMWACLTNVPIAVGGPGGLEHLVAKGAGGILRARAHDDLAHVGRQDAWQEAQVPDCLHAAACREQGAAPVSSCPVLAALPRHSNAMTTCGCLASKHASTPAAAGRAPTRPTAVMSLGMSSRDARQLAAAVRISVKMPSSCSRHRSRSVRWLYTCIIPVLPPNFPPPPATFRQNTSSPLA